MGELNLTNKADRIVNIDEKKGETITLVACFNAAGNYLPPCIILKGKSTQSPNILVLDGHDSHYSNSDILDYAVENGLCLLCLPPHTTNWLHPADKGRFVRNHSRAFTKVEFGDLIKEAWERVATVGLASNSSRATGMWPVNQNAIPNHAFISEVIPGIAQDFSTCQNPQSNKPTSGPPQSSKPHPTTTAPQLPSTANQITPT
ncbi:hypothetical protein PR048_002247, partial [Dryococelus australis]